MLTLANKCTLSIAVAANFAYTLAEILPSFTKNNHCRVSVSQGSTGKLLTQIKQGAPFDIFLAADKRPSRLIKEGYAYPHSLINYAIGTLVLWLPKKHDLTNPLLTLTSPSVRHIAIANPAFAPYGKAAIEILQSSNKLSKVKHKLVFGQNVNQAMQFILSGNAEAGFIAGSQLIAAKKNNIMHHQYSTWPVPQKYFTPIIQQAVILKRTQEKVMAEKFFSYLASKKSTGIIVQNGYRLDIKQNKVKKS